MSHVIDLIQGQIQTCLLLRSALFTYNGIDNYLFHFGRLAVDCGLCAAYDIFCERVPVLRERQGQCHFVSVNLHFIDNAEFHDVAVTFSGVLHIVEHFHYLILFHYNIKI